MGWTDNRTFYVVPSSWVCLLKLLFALLGGYCRRREARHGGTEGVPQAGAESGGQARTARTQPRASRRRAMIAGLVNGLENGQRRPDWLREPALPVPASPDSDPRGSSAVGNAGR